MSRVGKKPIPLPDKVKLTYQGDSITVEGQKGKLDRILHPATRLKIEDRLVNVTIETNTRENMALQGLTRSLVANMITGVDKGFEKVLQINGIGYRGEVKGKTIVFNLGYSHPIDFPLPEGINAEINRANEIKLSGIDKELLGQTAASIRMLRPPEPYKGKGIKYAEEYIQRKAGKTGAK
jgi:large subunit ribosomal protein L6